MLSLPAAGTATCFATCCAVAGLLEQNTLGTALNNLLNRIFAVLGL